MPMRLSFGETSYFNRYLLLILTHIPFLYPLYFALFLACRIVFYPISSSLSYIFDIFFYIFNSSFPLSHVIFLSLTADFPLKNIESLKLEIQRNVNLVLNPENADKTDLIDKNMKIEASFFKMFVNLMKAGMLVGLEVFSAYEFGAYWGHWVWKEAIFLIFGFIYCSNFSFKIYEKLGLRNSKILFFASLFLSFGIMRSFCELCFL